LITHKKIEKNANLDETIFELFSSLENDILEILKFFKVNPKIFSNENKIESHIRTTGYQN
jgi:hypothetical protein